MIPTKLTLHILFGLTALATLILALWPQAAPAILIAGATLLSAILLDALLLFLRKLPAVERLAPKRAALLEPLPWSLLISNPNSSSLHLEIVDLLDGQGVARCPEMPWSATLGPKQITRLTGHVVWSRRGKFPLAKIQLRARSPLGFWHRQSTLIPSGSTAPVRVFPNYEPVMREALLSLPDMLEINGMQKRPLAGASREFHQLRSWQDGDSFAQVDWTATSRRQEIISREFTEQRDQTLILMLDCSRDMAIREGEISQFDHALNALLYVAWLALRQGDRVGILGIGESIHWLSPLKGIHQMNRVLSHLFHYQTSDSIADWNHAARNLLLRQNRRSLVVCISALAQPLAEPDIQALSMIARKNKLVFADLESVTLRQAADAPANDLATSLKCAAAWDLQHDFFVNGQHLRDHKIHTIRSRPESLALAISKAYLQLRETL